MIRHSVCITYVHVRTANEPRPCSHARVSWPLHSKLDQERSISGSISDYPSNPSPLETPRARIRDVVTSRTTEAVAGSHLEAIIPLLLFYRGHNNRSFSPYTTQPHPRTGFVQPRNTSASLSALLPLPPSPLHPRSGKRVRTSSRGVASVVRCDTVQTFSLSRG